MSALGEEICRPHVAVFPTVESARSFEARLMEGRDDTREVARKGRTVTFTVIRCYDRATYHNDWRELVGYYGSTQARKATLDGHTCPVTF